LKKLAEKFDDPTAVIDPNVFTAARHTKFLGTTARKGLPTDDRPHRPAKLVHDPEAEVVSQELFEALAGTTGCASATEDTAAPEVDTVPDSPLPTTPPPVTDNTGWQAISPAERVVQCRCYLEKLDPAVSGQGGRGKTLRPACLIVHDFAVDDFDAALGLLAEFNEAKCFPKWAPKDLKRKITDALKRGPKDEFPKGCKLRTPDGGPPHQGGGGSAGGGGGGDGGSRLQNHDNARRSLPIARIRQDLDRLAGGWPRRVGHSLFVPGGDHSPRWLDDAPQLFAWCHHAIPVPPSGVSWAEGQGCVTKKEFHDHLANSVTAYRDVLPFPHHPPLDGYFYLHPPLTGGDGSRLAQLVDLFCPATAVDRDLILCMLATPFWGGPAGKRPAFWITAEGDEEGGRGCGKTTLAEAACKLIGGAIGVDAEQEDLDIDDVKKRLYSPEGRGKYAVLFDNLKRLKLSNGPLERLITEEEISGRRLHKGEGRRPNHFTYYFTVNGGSLARDIAQRVCPIVLRRPPAQDPNWGAKLDDLLGQHRWEVVGDLIALLQRPGKALASYCRWSR
jgi:hypothetical protein